MILGSFGGGTFGGTFAGILDLLVVWGEKTDWKCGLGEDRFSGQLFGQSWGGLEGKSSAFVREGVQKTRFTLNLFYVPPAPGFTLQN